MRPLLRVVSPAELPARTAGGLDAATLAAAAEIVADVRGRGEAALREHAERLDGLAPAAPLRVERAELAAAAAALAPADRALLERTAERIAAFARAQRAALQPVDVAVPGGRAGHEVAPVERAGCYAPGGRFPLPSSVLMTAVTARVAGVESVWVASPRPAPITLAAAHVAGADGLLRAGGAQAVAALAFGAGVPAVDVVVGPGNRWVTAAKQLVFGAVGIDALAGPSELVVWADATADPAAVAASLLAQAEHDADALPVLVTTDAELPAAVEVELAAQLATLPTAATARAALANGCAVVAADERAAAAACDALAPEHLQVVTADPAASAARARHYGALFLGPRSTEALGDYGIGPNHVLPTGRAARFGGGLSVLAFLRVRTWLRVTEPEVVAGDARRLARLEGLEAHARSLERRSAPARG